MQRKPNWTKLRADLGYAAAAATSAGATNVALGGFHMVAPSGSNRSITLASFATASAGRTTTVVNRCPFALTVNKASTNRFFGQDKSIRIAPEGFVVITEIGNNQAIIAHGRNWKLV